MSSPVTGSTSKAYGAVARRICGSALLAIGLVTAVSAQADHRTVQHRDAGSDDSYLVWVDVLDVDPIVRVDYVEEPVERCYETRERSHPRSRASWRHDRRDRRQGRADPGAVVIGGVLGGLIGNQFGGGNGKRALTVAGAVIGASVAAEASRGASERRRDHDRWREAPVRRCEISYTERRVERVDGYEVVYRYAGRRFTKVVDTHPGDRMRIRVDLRPV